MTVLKRFPNEGCDFGNGGGAVGEFSGMTRRFNYEYGVQAKIFQLTKNIFHGPRSLNPKRVEAASQ
jgi:hypothetical protein